MWLTKLYSERNYSAPKEASEYTIHHLHDTKPTLRETTCPNKVVATIHKCNQYTSKSAVIHYVIIKAQAKH